jgi:hypothetical protein
MPIKKKSILPTENNDIIALRAFVMPDLFPFLLDVYIKGGKSEETLHEDIRKAREKYKELVTASKQK